MNPLLPSSSNNQNLQPPPLVLPQPQPAMPPVIRTVNQQQEVQAEERDGQHAARQAADNAAEQTDATTAEKQGVKRKRSESSTEPVVKSARTETPPAPPVTLMGFIEAGNGEAVRTLLQRSPFLLEKIDPVSGLTPLCSAAKAGQVDIVKMLCNQFYAKTEAVSANGNSALMFAVEAGHSELVRELLTVKAPVYQTNSEGKSALYFAAAGGQQKLLTMLVEAGAVINAQTLTGETALMNAVRHGNVKAVCQLLRLHALVDLQDSNGNTALMHACQENQLGMLDMLLAANADFNKTNRNGRTCLMIATLAGHIGIAERLIEVGVSLDFPNPHIPGGGDSALHLACRNGKTEMAQLLLRMGANSVYWNHECQTPLQLACSTRQVDIVRSLIQRDTARDHVDANGKTALSIASANGSLEIVRLLLSIGADPAGIDTKGVDGNLNALDVAIKYSRYNVMEFLLQKSCTYSQLPNNAPLPNRPVTDLYCLDLLKHAALISAPDTADLLGLNDPQHITQPASFIEGLISQFTKEKGTNWQVFAKNQGLSHFIVKEIASHMIHLKPVITAVANKEKTPPAALGRQIIAGFISLSVNVESLKNVFSNKGLSNETEAAFNRMIELQCNFLMKASVEIQQRIKNTSFVKICAKHFSITGELNEMAFANELAFVHGIYAQNTSRLVRLFREALTIVKGKAADLPPVGSVGQVQLQSGSRMIELLGSAFKTQLKNVAHDADAPPGFIASLETLKVQIAQDDFISLVFDQWRLICAAHDVELPAYKRSET